jgi:hypothetical protein
MIRPATTRDIPKIIELQKKHIDSLRMMEGSDVYSDDPDMITGGIIEQIAARINNSDSFLWVSCNGDNEANGFLIGSIGVRPKYFTDWIVGNIETLYPITLGTSALSEKFREWAISKGGTAIFITIPIENKTAVKFCGIHKKMDLTGSQFMRVVAERETDV